MNQRMTGKKWAATMLAILLALSTVGAALASDDNMNALGEFPLVKEQETLTIFTFPVGNDKNFEDNWMTQYYEEKTNVKVDWKISISEQFLEKLNLALVSGEQIDLVISGRNGLTAITLSNLLKYANQGVILPLEDLIETETVYMKARLDEYEGWREAITTPSGHIYSLPSLNHGFHATYYGKMWVNKEFLSNVDLEIPTTTEAFHEMLLAFRDQDANGNGDPNDEVPLMAAIDHYGARIDTFLMSAFIYDDGQNRLFLDDGKVVAAFAQPEFREGLAYLNMLYEDDLIYKESFTQNRSTRAQLNSQTYESIVGALPNPHHGIGSRADDEPARFLEYEPIEPLAGLNGLQITRTDYYDKFLINEMAGVLAASSNNPALAMRWLDWFMSEEGTMTLVYGGEGVARTAADPGSTGIDGGPAVYQLITLEQDDPYYQNASWGERFPHFLTSDMRNGRQQPDMMAPDGTGLESFLYHFSKVNYEPYSAPLDMLIPPLYYDESVISEMALLTTDINTYVEESIARFVIGDLSVENDWDRFLDELEALNLSRYLSIIQETYDASAFAK